MAGDTYEIWDHAYRPGIIDDFINQAIMDATGKVYDRIENLSLHTDGHTLRFDIPSNISMIKNIYYRDSVESARLHSCNVAFDGAAVTNFTSSVDTQDKKQGTGSVRFKLDDSAGVAADAVLTANISSKDISKYDYLECWIKSSIATADGNLKISLDNTANCVSPIETLSVPALSQDTWTYVRMQLSSPELDTAIISVGLEQQTDIGGGAAYYVWLDDISVVRNDSSHWVKIPRHLWRIDRASTPGIVFDKYLDGLVSYSLLKIEGGDKPALLTADTTATEIDDSYIIARATALALSANSGGPNTDPDNHRQQAAFWFGMSQQSQQNFPMLNNVRTIS